MVIMNHAHFLLVDVFGHVVSDRAVLVCVCQVRWWRCTDQRGQVSPGAALQVLLRPVSELGVFQVRRSCCTTC